MPRPNKPKCVKKLPSCQVFFPDKGEKNSHEIIMSVEEYETLRLLDYQGMTQAECAKEMGIGRATVQSLYTEARKKTARFLVEAACLQISGGNFLLKREENKGTGWEQKGVSDMKIAITYENGEVFQHFGHTEQFKVYTVENQKLVSSEIANTNGSGHGALAGFLKDLGVEVLICGGIGAGARNALAEAGIRLFPGACGNADAQADAYLAGTLNYNPDTLCNHHHPEGACQGHDHNHETHACGGHCGH